MGEIQEFVNIKEIADLLNYSVDEIEELMERKLIPYHTDLEILTPTGVRFYKLAFPKQVVLSQIKPREKKKVAKTAKKTEPKKEEEPF